MIVINAFVMQQSGGVTTTTERALVQKSAGQIISSAAALIWGAETYDVGNWHDNATNNTRLTTPAGSSLARTVTNSLAAGSNNGAIMEQLLNGASFLGKGHVRPTGANIPANGANATSAPVAITGGTDYFTTTLQAVSGNFTPNTEQFTWDYAETLDPALPYILLSNSSNQATSNGVALALSWDTKTGTQTGWHSAGNPTRITPTSTLVRITGNISENNAASNTLVKVYKNGAQVYGSPCRETNNSGGDLLNFASAPISMNGTTDYLEVVVITNNASSILTGDNTWVCVEEVPATYQRALVRKSANQAAPANTVPRIFWESTEVDTASIVQTLTSTVTMTIASPGVITWTGHTLNNGDPVKLTTTGALPTGFTAGTIYYVVNKATNTFQLAASPGGAAINTSGSQSGTHTATSCCRLLAPAGTTEARITCNVSFSSSTGGIDFANTGAGVYTHKNGGSDFRGMVLAGLTAANGPRTLGGVSAWVPITALSDAFELACSPSAGISRNILANEFTWLCAEFR